MGERPLVPRRGDGERRSETFVQQREARRVGGEKAAEAGQVRAIDETEAADEARAERVPRALVDDGDRLARSSDGPAVPRDGPVDERKAASIELRSRIGD